MAGVKIYVKDNSSVVKHKAWYQIIIALEKTAKRAEERAKEIVPVRTGNLQRSIHSAVDENHAIAYVGTNCSYASHVEFGTVKQRPKPYLRPAV